MGPATAARSAHNAATTMPDPSVAFRAQGACTAAACPYLHVHLPPDAPVCTAFLRGHCSAGAACRQKHFTLHMVREEKRLCARRAAASDARQRSRRKVGGQQQEGSTAPAGGPQKKRRYFDDSSASAATEVVKEPATKHLRGNDSSSSSGGGGNSSGSEANSSGGNEVASDGGQQVSWRTAAHPLLLSTFSQEIGQDLIPLAD